MYSAASSACEQRLAGTARVDRRERPRRLQQDRWCLARLAEGQSEGALQPPGLGAGQRVAQLRRRLLQQRAGPERLARDQRRLGRREQPPGARALLGRQLRRAGQERHRGGVPAAVPRPPGRLLQPGRHRLIRPGRRHPQMPRHPIRLTPVTHRRQRLMNPPPLPQRRGVVDHRTDQGMPELHLRADLGQAAQISRRGRVRIDPQLPGRTPQQRLRGGRFGRGHRQQQPCLGRQLAHPAAEHLLQRPAGRQRLGQRLRPRQLGRRQLPGHLGQRQRVPAGLGDDPGTHRRAQPPRRQRRQQLQRCRLIEAAEHQLRQPR